MCEFWNISGKGKVAVVFGAVVIAILARFGYGTAGKSPDRSPLRAISSLPAGSFDVVATGHVATPKKDLVLVGSDFTGLIRKVFVEVNDPVRKGELLAVFDNREIAARVREEEGRIREAEAQRDFTEKEWKRTRILSQKAFRSPERNDRDRRNVVMAESRLDQERARLDRLQAVERKTEIRSPLDGIVLGRLANPGEEISRGSALFTVADLSRLRVLAEVGEFDTGHIRIDAPVVITADGYPGVSWKGRVIKIPHRVVPQRTNPEDPAAPVDIRVLNVRIAPINRLPLPLGQRVQVRIRGAGGP
jgi:multidrug efflux pump subunit AcrA (membrane-fusion protein)